MMDSNPTDLSPPPAQSAALPGSAPGTADTPVTVPHGSEGWLRRWSRSWVLRDVLLPFAATRAMLILVGWLALQAFPDLPAKPNTWEIKPQGQIGKVVSRVSPDVYPLINMWSRWDAGWYQSIAEQGYNFVPNRQSSTAFFPLYPMLMRGLHLLSPSTSDGSWLLSGIIVSNAALVAALVYLVLLVRIDFDHATGARAALYLLVFPTTLFFSAVYSESLFVALTLATFYHARRSQWWIAALFASAAALTRSPGVLLVAPLLLEYLMQRRFDLRKIRPDIAALAIIPATVALQMWYWSWRFGNMMATQEAQMAWGGGWGSLTWPWRPFVRFFQQPWLLNDVVNIWFSIALLVLTVLVLIKLRPSYGLYAVSCFLFVTSWGTLESVPRYGLVIFPAFIVLAHFGRKVAFDRAYIALASGLAAFFMIRFALWRWVA